MTQSYLGVKFKTQGGNTVSITHELDGGTRQHVGKGSDGHWRPLRDGDFGRVLTLGKDSPLSLVPLAVEPEADPFELIQKDPHQWGTRPCETCRAVSKLIGRSFGCELYREQQRTGQGRR